MLASYTKQYYGINPYAIEGACVGAGPDPNGGCFTSAFLADINLPIENQRNGLVNDPDTGHRVSFGQTFIPCISITGIRTYLNLATVQSSLHVSPSYLAPWDACSSHLHYNQYADELQWIYIKLLNAGYKITVYSGDTDSCVPYLGTEYCIDSMNLVVTQEWTSWTVVDAQNYTQIAGKIQTYEDGALTYMTVRGK